MTTREQRWLRAAVLGCSYETLLAHPEQTLSPQQQQHYDQLLQRRAAGEPMAYLLGQREFFGRSFHVSPATLIPRPETELLVEFVLARAAPQMRVLDLGTGSGAIAVSLAAERPDLHVTASDVNDQALAIAQHNNQALAQGRVRCVQSDWFGAWASEALGGTSTSGISISELNQNNAPNRHHAALFDFIVSNPPYIAAGDAHLNQGDLRFEPAGALTDGADGLTCLRHLIAQAPTYLQLSGWLAVEHGYNQAAAVRELMQAAGLINIATQPDLAGLDRITYAQKLDPT